MIGMMSITVVSPVTVGISGISNVSPIAIPIANPITVVAAVIVIMIGAA